MLNLFTSKLKESFLSVLPIVFLFLILIFTVAPVPYWSIVLFLISAFIMSLGIALFNLGVDMSLIPIGEKIGSALVKSKNLILIISVTFMIGVFITIAEPDLIVLAGQINGIPDTAIILVVALGVGLALVVAFLRILLQIPLAMILMGCYLIAAILSFFTGENFLSIAWESGAVTTGPITVPFVMALGLGLASVRVDKTTEEDSFGLVSLCLIAPIIMVLVMGMFFSPSGGSAIVVPEINAFKDIIFLYRTNAPIYLIQIAIALLPIILLFLIFQGLQLRLKVERLLKLFTGTIYTYLGLVLFLISANVGFLSVGYQLGSIIIGNKSPWVLVIVGFLVGFFVVSAEPSVFVLKKQVAEITEGAISEKSLGIGLSIGVAISVGLAMIRAVTGVSILYFIIPGYILVFILTFFVPPLFTSVAFDSGTVASGPLATTFMLPLAIGACESIGNNIYTDAFGVVALVAMTPVITMQIFGLINTIKSRIAEKNIIITDEEDTVIELDYKNQEEV